jgi:hypothetical protein
VVYTASLLILGWSTKSVKGAGCVYFVGGKEGAVKYLIGVNHEKKCFKYRRRIRVLIYYQMLYNI